MRMYLQHPPADDKPPRFYHLLLHEDLLDGWTLIREWGYQGSAGRVKREHHNSREAAELSLIKARDAQLRRGFRVVFTQGEEQPE